ncbi:MAG: sugar ABC transporter ATP-binding protein [Clostridiales bacterium]|nr:sugar ABC transporter ATP-binding protein [Clostridiales bacterium]
MEALLKIEGLTKRYGKNTVLDKVSFTLNKGEVHCLLGENGAGKSTLIKILSGAIAPAEGKIVLDGKEYSFLTPLESINLGISTIYQDVELIDSLSVTDNIFLGTEKTVGLGHVNHKAQSAAARGLIEKLHIGIDENAMVQNLSLAQKQMLQIAKAVHLNARILIMDEPTSSLGLEETKALMDMVRELKAEGVAIIYISHYIEEVFEIGDNITILKDGQYVGTYKVSETDIQSVIQKMVGRDASSYYHRDEVKLGEGVLEIKGYSSGDAVKDASFTIREGEILGMGGIVGAGRSELAELIFGIRKKDSGQAILNGQDITVSSPRDAIEKGFCMIGEDRKAMAMFPDCSVFENLFTVSREKEKGFLLDTKTEESQTSDIVSKVRIVMAGKEQTAGSLSGGNQQKTVIARWLLSKGKIFIFDEPTKGVDVGAREEIYKIIVELARNGNYIMLISSDMPELISLSDRIAVMREGCITQILEESVTEEQLLNYFIGTE